MNIFSRKSRNNLLVICELLWPHIFFQAIASSQITKTKINGQDENKHQFGPITQHGIQPHAKITT